MSALELALRNLAAWSVQVGVLGLAAGALSGLLPIERPAARLAFGQALLALVLGLPLLQPWHATAPAVTWSVAPSSALSPAPTAARGPVPSGAMAGWPVAAVSLLLLGVALRLAHVGAGLVRLRSLRRRARRLDAPPWLLALRDEVAPRARFLLSDETSTPATFGLRRPIVLLPPVFVSMHRERQAAVALHELLHARRADWLALMLEELRVDLLLKEVSMSRLRTLAHVGLTAAAIVLAVSLAASAVPLQSAKPAAPDAAKIAIEDKVTAPGEPKLIRQVRPVYPPEAKAEKVQGLILIDLVIGKDGAIKEAQVVASAPTPERLKELEPKKGTPAATEGDRRLAEAALAAVKQWQYAPILKDGRLVEFKATVTVNFKLS